jgi:hypothetical protein
MSKKKTTTIKRIDASTLKPKNPKPFDPIKFIKLAKAIQRAIEKEEEIYGKPQFSNSHISQ